MKSRGTKGLAVRYRPQLFSEVIGHEKELKHLQEIWQSPNRPSGYLFSGQTGTGKTTLARIVAISANCLHQMVFGEPCAKCRSKANQFDIIEIGGKGKMGVDAIKSATSAYDCLPTPPSLYRVYIIDEAQRMSEEAQDYLLKPFEDGPDTTLWIICTTNSQKLLPTLQGRCTKFYLKAFGLDQTQQLVQTVIDAEKAAGLSFSEFDEKKVEAFTHSLRRLGVSTPRNILSYLERFLVSGDPKVVLASNAEGDVRIGQKILVGNWTELVPLIVNLTDQELQGVRYSLLRFFRWKLLHEEKLPGPSAERLVTCINELCEAGSFDENISSHKILAALYNITKRFAPRRT